MGANAISKKCSIRQNITLTFYTTRRGDPETSTGFNAITFTKTFTATVSDLILDFLFPLNMLKYLEEDSQSTCWSLWC